MESFNGLNTRNSSLLDGKYREFFLPTILMAVTTTLSIVVDSIIVGNILGAKALAAVNLVMPVMMAYTTVAVLLGMGGATVISVAKGRRQDREANQAFTVLVASMASISLIFLAGQRIYLDPLVRVLTSEPTLGPLVRDYLGTLSWGTPVIVITLGLSYCLRADARVRLASAILITANSVNLVMDLVYMGLLNMGIAGSSLATITGYCAGSGLLLLYLFSRRRTLAFTAGVLRSPKQVSAQLINILTTGSPAALGSVLMTFKLLAVNTIVLSLGGKSGMVAFSVCISCLSFISMFISGAAQAMAPIVGVLFGEQDYPGIGFVFRRAVRVLVLSGLISLVFLEIFPGRVLGLFGVTHPLDFAIGIPAIRIFALSLPGTSLVFLFMYYYMTTGRKRLANAIALVQGFAVVVPSAWVLSQVLGLAGVWAAFPLAEALTLAMVAVTVQYLKTSGPDNYHDLLLLDRGQPGYQAGLELSITGSAGIPEAVRRLEAFFTGQGMTQPGCAGMVSQVAGTLACLLDHGDQPGQTALADLRARGQDNGFSLILRTAGPHPGTWTPDSPSRLGDYCMEICFSRPLGFNTFTFSAARVANHMEKPA